MIFWYRKIERRNKIKRKNGFTLIELLAVIVILAIIALIATPIILGIVEDAKRDAFLRSVEMLVSTTDLDIMNKLTGDSYTYELIEEKIIDSKEVHYTVSDNCETIISEWELPRKMFQLYVITNLILMDFH